MAMLTLGGGMAAALAALAGGAAAGPADTESWLFYSGTDITPTGWSVGSGARFSPFSPITGSGPLLAVFAGAGGYRYSGPGRAKVNGTFAIGDALAGYQLITPRHGVALLGGVRRERHHLDMPDPGNPVQGARTGLVAALDAWAKPAEGLLLTLSGNATTVFGGYYARAAAGRALPFGEDLFAGLEAVVLGNRQYRQYRLGAQVSGVTIGKVRLGIAAGWLGDAKRDAGQDAGRRDGFYSAVNLWHRE